MKKKILSLAALAIFTFTVSQFATANEPVIACITYSFECVPGSGQGFNATSCGTTEQHADDFGFWYGHYCGGGN